MTEVNGVAYINGSNGIYDSKIADGSVRYGRNAVANQLEYMGKLLGSMNEMPELKLEGLTEDTFDKALDKYTDSMDALYKETKERPPLHFSMRYMPKEAKGVDKKALLGAAYEEMGQRVSVPVKEMDKEMNMAFDLVGTDAPQLSVKAMDINKDGEVDIGEYSTSILVADALSSDSNKFDANNINGEITDDGQKALLVYANRRNLDMANKTYQALYETYNLNDAKEDFVKNPNNLESSDK